MHTYYIFFGSPKKLNKNKQTNKQKKKSEAELLK